MFTITLVHSKKIPYYEQVYQKIKTMIRSGELSPGDKLPSERSLSSNLQVSRNTINQAYLQLLSEGYIYVRSKSGYYISNFEPMPFCSALSKRNSEQPLTSPVTDALYDFSPFSLYTDGFPYKIWEKLYRCILREKGKELFLAGDAQGDFTLRESISKYLYEFRGFQTKPENIVIGAGAAYLLQLLNQLLPKELKIAMENPSYLQAYQIFQNSGRKIHPISLDKMGLQAEELKESDADIVYLTPAHQFPLGVVMPIRRRQEIYSWASKQHNRFIIEDDHDSEFRYRGKPIPSIKENDKDDKVIHIGTFSRTISPAIRIGFMVLPEALLKTYHESFSFYSSTVPRLEQAVLSEFISKGYYERHINKSRKIYKTRHDALLNSLKKFGEKIEVYGENAGVHIAVKFFYPYTEQELVALGKASKINLYGLSHFLISKEEQEAYTLSSPILLLGYASMSEEEITKGISLLYRLLSQSNES